MLFSEAIAQALLESMKEDPSIFLCGQLVNTDHSALTRGIKRQCPNQLRTFPVSENLMNSAAMGMSLAGLRPVVLHERFDFAMVGMDALVNHIPIWRKKCGVKLPLVMLVVRGFGKGQGPQQNKEFTTFFTKLEGWKVSLPVSADEAYRFMKADIFGDDPVMYVAYRELFE